MTKMTPGSSGNGQKPFLNVCYEQGDVEDGEKVEVRKVKETQSRAGFIVETDLFVVLLYKSSPWAEPLVSFLESMLSTDPGYALFVIVEPDSPQGIEMEWDETIGRLWRKERKFGGGILYTPSTPGAQGAGAGRKLRKAARDMTPPSTSI